MKVTVAIPLYNKAKFIEETIRSVLNQSYNDFELIIVDDGSTDGSQELVKKMNDVRIHFFQNEINLGTAGNANRIMDLCKTPFMIRQDADDLMPEHRIQKQLDFLLNNKDVAIVSGWNKLIGGNKIPTCITNSKNLKEELFFTNSVSQPAAGYNLDLIRSKGIRYEDKGPAIGEDWLFFYKVSKHFQMVNLPEIFNHYRIHVGNISNLSNQRYNSDIKSVLTFIFNDLNIDFTDDEMNAHFLFRKQNLFQYRNEVAIQSFCQWSEKLAKLNSKINFVEHEYLSKRSKEAIDFLFYTSVSNEKELKQFKKYFSLDNQKRRYYLSLRLRNLFKSFGHRKNS